MIRRGTAAELSPWIERARASLVASFARRVTIDEAAVRAAITSPWSNGQTEGQITRLDAARREAAYSLADLARDALRSKESSRRMALSALSIGAEGETRWQNRMSSPARAG
jgi:hypothetical protein